MPFDLCIDVCKPTPGFDVTRVDRDRLLETVESENVDVWPMVDDVLVGAEHTLVGGEVVRLLLPDRVDADAGDDAGRAADGPHDLSGDLVLHIEHVCGRGIEIELPAPQALAALRVGESRRHTNASGRPAYTSLQHVIDAQIVTHLLDLDLLSPVTNRGPE